MAAKDCNGVGMNISVGGVVPRISLGQGEGSRVAAAWNIRLVVGEQMRGEQVLGTPESAETMCLLGTRCPRLKAEQGVSVLSVPIISNCPPTSSAPLAQECCC